MCSHYSDERNVCLINGKPCRKTETPPTAICRSGVEFDRLKAQNEELQSLFKDLFP